MCLLLGCLCGVVVFIVVAVIYVLSYCCRMVCACLCAPCYIPFVIICGVGGTIVAVASQLAMGGSQDSTSANLWLPGGGLSGRTEDPQLPTTPVVLTATAQKFALDPRLIRPVRFSQESALEVEIKAAHSQGRPVLLRLGVGDLVADSCEETWESFREFVMHSAEFAAQNGVEAIALPYVASEDRLKEFVDSEIRGLFSGSVMLVVTMESMTVARDVFDVVALWPMMPAAADQRELDLSAFAARSEPLVVFRPGPGAVGLKCPLTLRTGETICRSDEDVEQCWELLQPRVAELDGVHVVAA